MPEPWRYTTICEPYDKLEDALNSMASGGWRLKFCFEEQGEEVNFYTCILERDDA